MKKLLKIIYTVTFSFLVAFGCDGSLFGDLGGDDSEDLREKEIVKMLAEAEDHLANGSYTPAREIYQEMVIDRGFNDSRPKFGYCISRALEISQDTVSELVRLVEMYEQIAGSLKATDGKLDFAAAQNLGLIAGMIQQVIGTFDNSLIRMDEYLNDIIADKNFVFRVKALPINVDLQHIMDARGEYDQAEAMVALAFIKILRGVVEFLLAYNFEFNTNQIVPAFEVLGDSLSISNIWSFFAFLIESSPKFLTLLDNGPERIQAAGQYFAEASDLVARAIQSAYDEKDNQLDDIFAIDRGADPPQIVFNVNFSGNENSDAIDVGILFFDITYELKPAAEALRDNFISGGDPIVWSETIAPVLSLAMVFLADTGYLKALINSFLGQISPDMAKLIVSIFYVTRLTPDVLASFVRKLVPDYMKFDFGAFFNNPVDIRYLLPIPWVPEEAYLDKAKVFESTFVTEYECSWPRLSGSGSLWPGILCPIDSNILYDGYHFPQEDRNMANSPEFYAEAEYQALGIEMIPADGISTVLPLFALRDPSIGGVIYIDVNMINGNGDGDAEREGFLLADNYSFNKALAGLSFNFVEILDGANLTGYVVDALSKTE